MWEPFVEPSRFQLNILRKCGDSGLDISPSTDVCLSSSKQLNLNISEPLIEVCECDFSLAIWQMAYSLCSKL
jgi:hypothetical protein